MTFHTSHRPYVMTKKEIKFSLRKAMQRLYSFFSFWRLILTFIFFTSFFIKEPRLIRKLRSQDVCRIFICSQNSFSHLSCFSLLYPQFSPNIFPIFAEICSYGISSSWKILCVLARYIHVFFFIRTKFIRTIRLKFGQKLRTS